MTAANAVLLLVDLQQRLMPAIHDGDKVIARAARLGDPDRYGDPDTPALLVRGGTR